MLMLVYWHAHTRVLEGNGAQLPALPRRCDFHAMPTRLRGPMAILHGDVGATRSVKIIYNFYKGDIGVLATRQELRMLVG